MIRDDEPLPEAHVIDAMREPELPFDGNTEAFADKRGHYVMVPADQDGSGR